MQRAAWGVQRGAWGVCAERNGAGNGKWKRTFLLASGRGKASQPDSLKLLNAPVDGRAVHSGIVVHSTTKHVKCCSLHLLVAWGANCRCKQIWCKLLKNNPNLITYDKGLTLSLVTIG